MSKVSVTYKQILGEIKQIDRSRREFEFVASCQEVDADKEVVVTRGIDTETRYAQNRTMFLNHDPSRRYARVDALWLGSVRGADALLGRATVLPPGVSAEADQAYAEMIHGALNGISIGFLKRETDLKPILPKQTGVTYKKIELVEISLVPLGSCPSAVVTAKSVEAGSPDIAVTPQLVEEVTRQVVRDAVVEAASARAVRFVSWFRGGVPDFDLASIPTPRGKDITVPDLTPGQLAAIVREAVRTSAEYHVRRMVESEAQRGILRLRGRVD